MPAIELFLGDIAQLDCDALVNAANNRLWMGAGVASALKRAGGQEIEDAAMKKGSIPIGDVAVTGAGRLKAKSIIHAAVMGQDLRTDAGKIRQATRNTLLRAEELGITSLAFPALGTGIGGFPLEECARIMLSTIKEHLKGKTGLKKVVLALYGEAAYRAFDRVLAELQGNG